MYLIATNDAISVRKGASVFHNSTEFFWCIFVPASKPDSQILLLLQNGPGSFIEPHGGHYILSRAQAPSSRPIARRHKLSPTKPFPQGLLILKLWTIGKVFTVPFVLWLPGLSLSRVSRIAWLKKLPAGLRFFTPKGSDFGPLSRPASEKETSHEKIQRPC